MLKLLNEVEQLAPQSQKLRHFPSGKLIARAGQIHIEHAADAPGIRFQRDDPVAEIDRFFQVVGNEECRYRALRDDGEHFVLKFLPGHCIQGAERLVHQQHVRLLRQASRDLKPLLQKTELTVDAADGWSCELDKAQVKEALHNIMANAVEAMKGTGKLTVSLQEQKRELIVEIRDSGPGIPANRMKRIFEPFYTTKGGGSFGLGLPYAYHVMRKHKGSLTVRSKDGEGTVFYMIFPKRHVAAKRLAPAGESAADAGVTGA